MASSWGVPYDHGSAYDENPIVKNRSRAKDHPRDFEGRVRGKNAVAFAELKENGG